MKELNPRQPINELDEEVLSYWQKNRIYEKVKKASEKKPYFSFYDGPPFATGLPHHGHLLVSAIKDSVLRYWSMRGKRISRRVGWDCHGLPVENLIEKELGLRSKKDIEKIGIEKFNARCRDSVLRYASEWVKTLSRLGRWADYNSAYRTMDNDYIESVWWVFKNLWDQGLIYESFRVTPYCPRCGTPLSNFEVGQGYKDVTEPSVYLKFKIKGEENIFFLVWTTTPWTLPGNLALAVHKDVDYVKVKRDKDFLVLAKERLKVLVNPEVVENVKGKDLVGKGYEPLYDVFQKENKEGKFYKVWAADFVSTEEGTGIVHIAPHFGDDDFNLFKENEITIPKELITINEEGKVIKGFGIPGEGKPAKDADNDIKKDLKKRGILFKEEDITHSYPFCWRCDEPLLYYPIASWYVEVTKLREKLIQNNKKIHWVPAYLKEGRFGKWLEEVRDWAVSRNRFWGAPIPIWICEKCGKKKAVGSIKELDSTTPKDLHRPYIDKVELKCKCGGKMKRVTHVFDCWFESGSMPYASWHYPFENKKLVESNFPADFIAEAVDQTRGWFYTLHVLASALTLKDRGLGKDKPAFKNVISNGLVLAEDGKKLSKKLKNYTEPDELMKKFGADSFRLFLLTGAPIGENYFFGDKAVQDVFRSSIITLLNSYSFFLTYAKVHNFKPIRAKSENILDKWLLSELNSLLEKVNKNMEDYELVKAARLIPPFVDNLSNWYLRRSRRRLKEGDKEVLNTLYGVLLTFTRVLAPFTPFIAEKFYLSLDGKKESVHLESFPRTDKKLISEDLNLKMRRVREIASKILALRKEAQIRIRQPLKEAVLKRTELFSSDTTRCFASRLRDRDKNLEEILKEEVNVLNVVYKKTLPSGKNYLRDKEKTVALNIEIDKKLKLQGLAREVVRQIQDLRKRASCRIDDKIELCVEVPSLSKALKKVFDNKELVSYIQRETLTKKIIFGKIEDAEKAAKAQIGGEEIILAIKR